jgi:hypothetical protein
MPEEPGERAMAKVGSLLRENRDVPARLQY